MSISSSFETLKRAGDSLSSRFESIQNNLESAIGRYVGTFSAEMKNGSMTGINYQGAVAINTAIENWLSKIDQDLSQLEALDPTGAFKGEQFITAIQDFIVSVRQTCHNVSSNLREFQDILNRAITAYKARDTQLKSDIGSTSESIKSQASEYEHVGHQG